MRELPIIAGACLSVAAAACLALSACATPHPQPPKPTPPPPAPAQAVAVCPPVVTYSLSEEAAQAAALQDLQVRDPGNPLIGLVVDYGHMRAAGRACASGAE